MSTTSMAIFSNPLFATYSVYARNASVDQSYVMYTLEFIIAYFCTFALYMCRQRVTSAVVASGRAYGHKVLLPHPKKHVYTMKENQGVTITG